MMIGLYLINNVLVGHGIGGWWNVVVGQDIVLVVGGISVYIATLWVGDANCSCLL